MASVWIKDRVPEVRHIYYSGAPSIDIYWPVRTDSLIKVLTLYTVNTGMIVAYVHRVCILLGGR